LTCSRKDFEALKEFYKMKLRKGVAVALVLLVVTFAAGCTTSNGVFTGFSHSSTDTSLSASYVSFNGSLTRRVELKAGDEVTFSLEGGEGLEASVMKDGEPLAAILDGGTFTATESGNYDFGLKGKAENGSFTLSWQKG
jgi:hypothetical protein